MISQQQSESQNEPEQQGKKSRTPTWVRWIVVVIFILGIGIGAVVWIVFNQGPLATTISVIFVALGLIFSFIQILPSYLSSNESSVHHTHTVVHVQSSSSQPINLLQTKILENTLVIPSGTTQIVEPQYQSIEEIEHTEPKRTVRSRIDWGEAPQTSIFYGRQKELVELERWIVDDSCLVVAIVGIGGIGKSALAAKLVEKVENQFEYVIWRSLQNAPPLESLVKNCIQFLSNQRYIELSQDIDGQITLLIQYLRDHKCLLILDNVETVLQGGRRVGDYREGYEGYGKLLRRISETKHQSCLLFTSREKPREIVHLEGEKSPTRLLQLLGLEEEEGRNLLQHMELFGSDDSWSSLINLYSGNPLSLKLASELIRDVFGGDVTEFLKIGKATLGDVRYPLDIQFARLAEEERDVIYWLAIKREKVSLDDLQADMVQHRLMDDLPVLVASLRRRSMIELSGAAHYFLQPVILEYVTGRFVERVCDEIETNKIMLFGSHPLIEGQAKDYVRSSQVHLILVPITKYLLNSIGKDQIDNNFKDMLETLRRSHSQTENYAAGNMLNLLVHRKADISSYNFSYLTIWQAYLQGASLPYVDFSHARFAKSVFTETFGTVFSVAFSPNGRLLAAGTDSGEVRIWYAASGIPMCTYQGHTDWVRCVTFSPDGNLLASSSNDQTIRLWKLQTGECQRLLLGHTRWIWSVTFSPDGDTLASASEDGTIKLWNVQTGECPKTLEGHTSWVWAVAFSPRGGIIASASEDKSVRLWDLSTGQCSAILEGHTKRVGSVAFSPDGNTLASASSDQTVRLWSVQAGQCIDILHGHTERVRSVVFSPDGNTLASGSNDQSVRLWNVSSGECLRVLYGHTNWVWSVAFSPDGNTLASGSEDQSVRLWNVGNGDCLKRLYGYTNWVWSIAFSPDGKAIACSSGDQSVRIWDTHSGKCLKALYGHTNRIWAVAFSPDGTTIASGSSDQTIRLWNAQTGKCFKTLYGHTNRIWTVAFSPDGNTLASGSNDQSVRLWNISTGESVEVQHGYMNRVWSVAYNPNGKTVASGGNSKSIRLWNVSNGQCIQTLDGHTDWVWSLAWSPNENMLGSSGEDKSVRLWDISSGECLQTLIGHTERVRSVAFSPMGDTIASASEDKSIRLWDVNSGECIRMFLGHRDWVWTVAFSPEGNIIASGSEDGTIKLWSVQTGDLLTDLSLERPYEHMNISHVEGLTEAQKSALIELGAIEVE